MTLPVPTTTVTVRRPAHDVTVDAYDPDTGPPATVVAGLPAHFSSARATETPAGSSQTTNATLLTDPADLVHTDLVIDDSDGSTWTVLSARAVNDPDRAGPENDSHVTATVVRVEGAG